MNSFLIVSGLIVASLCLITLLVVTVNLIDFPEEEG